MRTASRIWLIVLILACTAGAEWLAPSTPVSDMAEAARRFLDSLTAEQRGRATLAFDDKAREDWHYVPRRAPGVEFSEMTGAQRIAARNLLRSALSSRGMHTVEEIMLLDAILRDIEQGRGPRRDPLAYSIAIFGSPPPAANDPAQPSKPWGWKIEGHHLSLNFTVIAGKAAVTPSFFGANPAEVKAGDRAGVRVLASEEDLAWRLLATFDEAQRQQAIISDRAPRDILAVPGRALDQIDDAGLDAASMTEQQRAILQQLLEQYAGRLRPELAEHELQRIREAGLDKLRFAWMGSERRGEGHYYRLSSPSFIIEYDNTQDGANHVHTVWRDRTRDFGQDLLKEHHLHDHPHD